MRARINHGKRGTKMETLLRLYEMEYPQDYYDYILESYSLGHRDQVIELFNAMKGENQRTFLINVPAMSYIQGERVQFHIINSL